MQLDEYSGKSSDDVDRCKGGVPYSRTRLDFTGAYLNTPRSDDV